MIYLDHAAATPLAPEVMAAMQPFWQDEFYNPSALYTKSREAAGALRDCRSTVARLLGVKAGEIYFTAGATESINLSLAGIMQRFPGKSLVTSPIEHSAVLETAVAWANPLLVAVDTDGLISPEKLAQTVREDTVLVSLGYVNSEIGTIQPLKQIAGVLDDIRRQRAESGNKLPLYLHIDASAAAGYVDLQVRRLGADLLTLNGGKMYGPKQSGILYVRHGIILAPLIRGGGQENGLRSGTENIALNVGFATALELAEKLRSGESKRQLLLREQLITGALSLPGSQLNGHSRHHSAGNVNLSFRGVNGETAVHYLDAAGIMAATGAACRAGLDQPSPVLTAIGVNLEMITGSLRFSLGRSTTAKDITATLVALQTIIPKLRRQG